MHGRAAAAKLFATIDRVPPIDSSDPSGLKPEQISGEISFEHVSFNYPSRPDIRVVEDLSISFPAGKTCALVGASGSGKSTVVALIERGRFPGRHFRSPRCERSRLTSINASTFTVFMTSS